VATGQEVACFNGHKSYVGALAFTPDGRTLATGSGDSTILLWDLTGHAQDGRPRHEGLSPDRLERCWADLRGDARAAYRAVWALACNPREAAPFLDRQLGLAPADPSRLARLVAALDADSFADREPATAELERLGDAAAPALRKLRDDAASAEARRRADALLDKLASGPEWLRARRAVAALEYAGTREARRVLEGLATGSGGSRLAAEARAALDRLPKSRGGK
jgi:hypothetical protein